jgi:hypothetical protein
MKLVNYESMVKLARKALDGTLQLYNLLPATVSVEAI